MPRRIAIVGGGISGLGVAWALSQQPDRFDFRLFEAQANLGGNAVTADMPQDDGTSIPFDISVTACIPSVYHHILLLTRQLGVGLVETRFSYSVKYRDGIYAHDMATDIGEQLRPEIDKFQKLLRRMQWFGRLNQTRSKFLNALNPFNYLSMGAVLNFGKFSGDFRYKVLKTHVRQFSDGDQRLRYAGLAVLPISGVLQHRLRHADAHMGGRHAPHLRKAGGGLFATRSTLNGRFARCCDAHRRWWSRTSKATPKRSTMWCSPAMPIKR